jgi:hypothetical protein
MPGIRVVQLGMLLCAAGGGAPIENGRRYRDDANHHRNMATVARTARVANEDLTCTFRNHGLQSFTQSWPIIPPTMATSLGGGVKAPSLTRSAKCKYIHTNASLARTAIDWPMIVASAAQLRRSLLFKSLNLLLDEGAGFFVPRRSRSLSRGKCNGLRPLGGMCPLRMAAQRDVGCTDGSDGGQQHVILVESILSIPPMCIRRATKVAGPTRKAAPLIGRIHAESQQYLNRNRFLAANHRNEPPELKGFEQQRHQTRAGRL